MEEHRIEINQDQNKIVGILNKPNPESKSVIILVHGFTGSKEGPSTKMFQITIEKLLQNDFSVFRFDFRGTGESGSNFKNMTVDGETKDLQKVISYMKHIGFEKIGLVGESLGATVSIKDYNRDINCIVLWYPAIILRETGLRERFLTKEKSEELAKKGFIEYKNSEGEIWKVGKKFIDDIKNLNLEINLSHIKVPTLLIHAEDDDIVDIKQSRYAFDILSCEKELERIKSGGHGFNGTQEEVANLTADWFKKWFRD